MHCLFVIVFTLLQLCVNTVSLVRVELPTSNWKITQIRWLES